MLHIFNSEAAAKALKAARVPGDVLAWGDPLVVGPIPAGAVSHDWRSYRANYLASINPRRPTDILYAWLVRFDEMIGRFVDYDELVFWGTSSLADMLTAIYLIDRATQLKIGDIPLSLVCVGDIPGLPRLADLGQLSPLELSSFFGSRQRLTRKEIVLIKQIWAAFRSPEADVVERMTASNTASLPFLHDILVRHLQQFPSVRNGLNRTEWATLDILAENGEQAPDALACAVNERETHPFLTQQLYFVTLESLAAAPYPAVRLTGTGRLPRFDEPMPESLGDWSVSLTDFGADLRAGRADWIDKCSIDRWVGGVHLEGHEASWRWDQERMELVRKGALGV